jgi:hypothetical protein
LQRIVLTKNRAKNRSDKAFGEDELIGYNFIYGSMIKPTRAFVFFLLLGMRKLHRGAHYIFISSIGSPQKYKHMI